MISDAADVIIVPFPFVDAAVVKPRPALVLSTAAFNGAEGVSTLAMITTAANSRRPHDHALLDWAAAGLRTPSYVRMKLFTVDNTLVSRIIGRLNATDWSAVQQTIAAALSLQVR